MFWNKKADPKPYGVPLNELEMLLATNNVKVARKGNALLVDNGRFVTRVDVVPPEVEETDDSTVAAVVRILSDFPKSLGQLFKGHEADSMATFNSFASLSALYSDNSSLHIGSRLTIYQGDGAWESLHLPLLLATTLCGADSILGAMRRTFAGDLPNNVGSEWDDGDFDEAHYYLSRFSVCNFDSTGLTAEFGLAEGEVSAALNSHRTALFQMMSDEPHPELGGGLFCLLQMPHQIKDEGRLQKICSQLNLMEMAALDLPPHFGAWCPGKLGTNPSYVSFLPDALHEVKGIAANFGVWAMHRAQWANAMLASLGSLS